MKVTHQTPGAFERTICLLTDAKVPYQLLEHAAEGRTEEVSTLRGHVLEQALKCMVVLVKLGKKHTRFVLVVVRGNQRVDFKSITRLLNASYVGFAQSDKAEELTGCEMGTVLPFSFHEDLTIIADESLRGDDRLVYFNAASLDKSLAISANDYLRTAKAQIAPIGQTMNQTS